MKNSDAEEMLLKNASLEDLIKMKIEKEFMEDLKKSKEVPKILKSFQKKKYFRNLQCTSILTVIPNVKALLTVFRQRL